MSVLSTVTRWTATWLKKVARMIAPATSDQSDTGEVSVTSKSLMNKEFVKLSLLPAGSLTLPEHFFCADQLDKNVRNSVPSMSFLLQHPPSGRKVVFDLGMRKILQDYPEEIQPHIATRRPISTEPDASDSLRRGGLEPSCIDAVVLSHVHYDHVGTPKDFPQA